MTQDVYERLALCVLGKKPNDALFAWENGDQVKDFRAAWDKMTVAAKVDIEVHGVSRGRSEPAGEPEKEEFRAKSCFGEFSNWTQNSL